MGNFELIKQELHKSQEDILFGTLHAIVPFVLEGMRNRDKVKLNNLAARAPEDFLLRVARPVVIACLSPSVFPY